ncbi:MAG: DUF4876 domain-containing protein [Bacteroidales bacterium]|nr:DUF4876 domain-containing protein [Bacteroidales bacterium]
MKRLILILLAALLAAACAREYRSPWPDGLQLLSINAVYPAGYADAVHEGAVIRIEEVSSGAAYRAQTDRRGLAEIRIPAGIYRITCSDRTGKDLFNGTADKVVVTERRTVDLLLAHSRAGSLVIKEVYTGGCSKAPQEGTYQSDQYFIIHNNDTETAWLDSLCFGTLSPYNSTAVNNWVTRDAATGELVFPDFAPVVTVVWQLPGNGRSFPLEPGEDAVVALRGAIDHTLQYPLSVNLNRSDVFTCYNPTYFPNPTYHPAPGDQVRADRYAQVVIKTGQANANTVSLSSPTLVLFRTPMPAGDYVLQPDVVQVTPGNSADRVVKVPYGWVIDAVEVFDGRSGGNAKRVSPAADAGFVMQSDIYKGHTLRRRVDEAASAENGYEVLMDTNNSSNDFYESEIQSLHR